VSSNTKTTTLELKPPRKTQSRSQANLARNYNEIGISAVAAATPYQGKQRSAADSRAPSRVSKHGVNDTD
jgi:predicted aconitase